MFEDLLPYDTAHLILGDYLMYHYQYKRITKRAKIRFEKRDWYGMQEDSRERISLYRDSVGATTEKVLKFLGEQALDQDTWRDVKIMFLEEITNFNSRNIAETYFNSVFRHSHRGLSVDQDRMFVHATATYREFKSTQPIYHTLFLTRPFNFVIQQLFAFFRFKAPFEDLDRDIGYICDTLQEKLVELDYRGNGRIEILKAICFRNKGAYLVGRLIVEAKTNPFVLPLLHREDGIFADALLLESNEISSVFSYNRTYFLVDTDIASETVDFLRSILPTKSMGELYNSIGFEKHGKTVLYRDFLRHMHQSIDKFVLAPGIKGLVMVVFTLPSYPMVFKIIKDKFPAPKKVTEQEVKSKYELVSLHDRVGRMADSHMFENFVFDRRRFSKELIDELIELAPSKIKIEGDKIELKHLYIEKKMVPLNIYLEDATIEEAEEVINEYGKAIKEMAAVNIFPGDMLLKNFGVTRLKRVVFYDYDEIGFLTDYNFRVIPEARDYEDEMSAAPWYSVGHMDVFPEEFPRFLIGRKEVRDIFLRLHGDLFSPGFWIKTQERLRNRELVGVFPYRQKLRFRRKYGVSGKASEGGS